MRILVWLGCVAALVVGLPSAVAGVRPSRSWVGNSPAAASDQLWASRYNGPGNNGDYAEALGVSPDGSEVFVAGSSTPRGSGPQATTVAYDAATGAELWVQRYNDGESYPYA